MRLGDGLAAGRDAELAQDRRDWCPTVLADRVSRASRAARHARHAPLVSLDQGHGPQVGRLAAAPLGGRLGPPALDQVAERPGSDLGQRVVTACLVQPPGQPPDDVLVWLVRAARTRAGAITQVRVLDPYFYF